MTAGDKHIHTFHTGEILARVLAENILDMIRDSHVSGRNLNIALSGGSTPKILFEHLARFSHDLDMWENVNIYWVDERCVPPDHPDSNFGLCNEILLRHIKLSSDHVFRMMGEKEPHDEAARYSGKLLENLPSHNDIPAFDLVLLGMGNDGHTASIFPDQMQLLTTDQICDVGIHPKSRQHRVTLTGKVINNAHQIYFLVTGTEKADIVAMIIEGEPGKDKYPAAHINPTHGTLSWFLDASAAAHLKK
ncbi:6-phosphogluconolactonase [Bacteroidota bacterium]